MSQASFPGPGPDGEQPPPGGPARDDDWDGDAEMASYIADLDAGRARIPEEWEIEGPAATIGLGDAADVDLVELAAMLGPDGLGGEVFARDRSADAMRPGPVLAALTEQAAGDLGRLTDNQVHRRDVRRPAAGGPRRLAGADRGRGVHPPPRSPVAGRDGARGCRAAAGTASSPTPSSAWNWSPPPAPPAT